VNHSTGTPTKAERVRLETLSVMRCVCCEREGATQLLPTEVHHLVDMGTRKLSGGHMATIPLCGWHHRGVIPERSELTTGDMLFIYGPSKALNGRLFRDTYGTDRELLELVNARMELAA